MISKLSSDSTNISSMKRLEENFRPGPYDVICARGKNAKNHIGNKRFREKIVKAKRAYEMAESRLYKSLVVSSIVDSIRKESPNGGFVKEMDGVFYEVGDHLAREKTGQALREQLHSQYKSSAKSKQRRKLLHQQICEKQQRQTCMILDSMVLSNSLISKNIEEMETIFYDIGGAEAPDNIFLELCSRNNEIILNTIASDPTLQQGIQQLASSLSIEAS